MGKLVLEANVRLKGSMDIDKKDFIRAIVEELGFEREDVNVTKFSYKFFEEEGEVNV